MKRAGRGSCGYAVRWGHWRCVVWGVVLAVCGVAEIGCGKSAPGPSLGGSGGSDYNDAADTGQDAVVEASTDLASEPADDLAPSPDVSTDAAADAASLAAAITAAVAAAGTSDCKDLAPFYWEIGTATGVLVKSTAGGAGLPVTGNTMLYIASASKFLWGAYVVERFKDDLSRIDAAAMTMRSGRTNFGRCLTTDTVGTCCGGAGLSSAQTKNCDVVAGEAGFFNYGGGHFQQYAIDLGLGDDGNDALTADMQKVLGTELAFSFGVPQPAGGAAASPAEYGTFLRKILSGGLAIRDHLGEAAVCTLPATCPQAHGSPVPRPWHYSYGHWVEDDPATGDGAFSSPGAYGFYPWIDAGKRFYGILARQSIDGLDGPLAQTPYYRSIVCGQAIRRAFMGTLEGTAAGGK